MPNLTSNAQYMQILSMSLEQRASGYQDLVSNNNALLAVMKRKGLWQTYHGPRIRQTLQVAKQIGQWYSGSIRSGPFVEQSASKNRVKSVNIQNGQHRAKPPKDGRCND